MAIHLIYLLRRLPHVSFEGFDAHRGQIHGALIAALPAIKSGVVKYKQFHVLPETNAALAAQGMPVMTYDGIAELEAEKLEDILELFASDEMAKVI
ncbi:hypothetical protein C8R47DRAFT_1208729 [Mycena vitilis]|nr:hypothetical protein C8R47DRAFT_1208729 [Mycena vitilis]